MTTAILLNSGGLDSRVAAAMIRRDYLDWELHSLFVDYNRDDDGLAAQVTADMYGCKSHHVVAFSEDWMIQKTEAIWGIPFKAVFTLTMGAMYANVIKAEYVVSGVRTDLGGDPVPHLQMALNELTPRNAPVILWAPLFGMSVDEIAKEAAELAVDTDNVSTAQ